MHRRFPITAIAALFAVAATGLASNTWVELSTARFTVRSDAGDRSARQIVRRLQEIDDALAVTNPLFDDRGSLHVYLFASETEFSEYRQHGWEGGFTYTLPNQAPVILVYQGPQTESTLSHEYVHALIQGGRWRLPNWFEEGLAELFSNVEIGTKSVTLGRLIPRHAAVLASEGVDRKIFSGALKPDHPSLFYATAWALVQMLHLDKRYQTGLGQFIEDLQKGMPDSQAFQHAFGRSMQTSLDDLAASPRNSGQTMPRATPAPVPAARSRAIDATEATLMLADLLLDEGKTELAIRRYRQAARAHPNDASGEEALGLAALAAGDSGAAIRHFRTSTGHGNRNGRAWSELAALERDNGADWPTIKPLLERAASLDPTDFRSNFLLGVRKFDDGDTANAILSLAAATAAAPARADAWHAYAMALIKANRTAEARVAVRRGQRAALTLEQERMLIELEASIDRPKAAHGKIGPAVTVSPAWSRPAPDAYIEGHFKSFECAGEHPVIRLDVDGKLMQLIVFDPSSIQLRNAAAGAASVELRCGPQQGEMVRVGYTRSSNTVLSIEFLQVRDSPWF